MRLDLRMLPRGQSHHGHASTGDVRFPCRVFCPPRPLLLLVYLLLLCTSARCAEAGQRMPRPAGTAASTESVENRTNLLPKAGALAAQHFIGDRQLYCPAPSFSFFLAAAMGLWSRHDRLASCLATKSSTVLDDIRLSREDHESHDTLLSELWRRARGIRERHVFYDNADEFIALETEISRAVRVNHTVGMYPPQYSAVLSKLADILGLNFTADLLPLNGNGPLPIIADGPGMDSVDEECAKNPACLQRGVLNEYRRHANRTLQASPHLIVSEATFTRAMAYYKINALPSVVVRAYDLRTSHANSFEHDVADFLRTVQDMWDAATREVQQEREDGSTQDATVAFSGVTITDSRSQRQASRLLSRPFLPFIRVTDFTGPPMLNQTRAYFVSDRPEPPSRGSGGMHQRPLHRVLPAAVVYHTSPSCASCEVYDRAFDLLPGLFKSLCSRPHMSMISCSPVTLFFRTTNTRTFDLVPSMDMYARLVYTREAVLRTADTNGNFFDGGSADSDDDDEADVARFYSLNSKYRSNRIDLEREIRPRTQFTPHRISLRHVSDAASVEEALTSMFSELVEHGVVQFAFMGKSQLSRILKKNQEVQERMERRRREEEKNARSSANTAATTSSPAPSLEADPEYRKVVTFHDLATELVSSYIRSYIGNVTLSLGHRRRYRNSASSSGYLWVLWLLIDTVVELWHCIRSELENPLIPAFFLILCAVQRLWNRVGKVTYW
ncbi:hypothetical protein JKF63_01141 [Porcisia hertigi]|uniref:Uncharacterized protein n=1 Tax=Porcisia hertigi TaxID=2761500 RepID=A0A836L0D1_9TRYP|nr:hypothetical protein JKF63_01141 [Porcisia hertigi]